jgi:hypothetical protein
MNSVRAAISFLVVTVWTITAIHARESVAVSSAERCLIGVAGIVVVSAESTPGAEDRMDSDPGSHAALASLSSLEWMAREFGGISFRPFTSCIDARLLQFESLFVRAP